MRFSTYYERGVNKMQLDYRVVDVFTRTSLQGNPVAVFVDAEGISATIMQKIAKELNLSETVFVLPASREDCDVRARIFNPAFEMSFAGHPTIGAAYVVREAGIVAGEPREIVLEELAGPVQVRIDEGDNPIIWLKSPPVKSTRGYDPSSCSSALGLTEEELIPNVPCRLLTAGVPCIFVALRDKVAIDRAVLDPIRFAALHADQKGPVSMFVFAPVSEGAYSRMFAPELGITEDPATGSATSPLAVFMMEYGLVASNDGTRFISEQGTKLGRRSLLHVHIKGSNGSDGIYVGGQVAPVARATMTIDVLETAA